ncbi:hypothetical protein BLNAU_6091 [Blattamonas nauphoetae]|uniref:Protein kinase domain-containing protein n=1 Tax=Blattamonas nauphoetae TaxID=2049346 RepID=A0ABQ9Y513_9EUKA|nr:hypothetical protein BLNAU_6091 [Blattamonas nauphoetae]
MPTGSTIRNVNNGGSVLCSNSTFSSLLPSPNTDPSIILPDPDEYPTQFQDGIEYYFDENSGTQASAASFTNCGFTGNEYPSHVRPLTFNKYPGTISILSCSFDNITSTGSGGVVSVDVQGQSGRSSFSVTSSNFTNCSTTGNGGAMHVNVDSDVLINLCRFVDCSATGDDYTAGGGGGVCSNGFLTGGDIQQLNLVDCVFSDCTASKTGAGVHIEGHLALSVVSTNFERCELLSEIDFTLGGGLCMNGYNQAALTVESCRFIECLSKHAGGAIASMLQKDFSISDTLVKDCFSGTTGAVYIKRIYNCEALSFTDVYFDGNSFGEDRTFFASSNLNFEVNTTKLTDVTIMCDYYPVLPTLTFERCFTTVSSDSSGMIIGKAWLPSFLLDPERYWDVEFTKIGPLLTASPTANVNEKTGKIELEMEGMTPPISQEYEVRAKEEDGTSTTFRMLFADGTGTLFSESEVNLKYNTNYTITSIVGVIPESSSSQMTNDIPIPRAAWVFNFTTTSDYLTFTTPEPSSITPPETPSFSTLQDATARLVESDPQSAFILLHFDKEVLGSFDFVVEEEGKLVTLTFTNEVGSAFGGTKEIKSMSPEMKKLLSWLLPLVACLLVGFVIAIIITVLLRHRKQKKAELAQKEMEVQEPLDVEKVDEVGVDCSNGVIRTDENDESALNSSDVGRTRVNQPEEVMSSASRKEGELVEVMTCGAVCEISTARIDSTLYSVLHKERREIGKRGIGLQIVNGLKHVVAHRPASDVLTRLSSHWILVDAAGNVQLKLQMTSEEAKQEAARTQLHPQPLPNLDGIHDQPSEKTQDAQMDQSGMDGLRWQAPEVVESGVGTQVDGHKASVFSLGLVLWEIETGLVPFGELDAVNAQRQSGTGVGPKMESLKNEEFVSLIHRCVSVDPKQRPTLTDIGEFLSSHPDDTRLASGMEMKEPEP